MPYVIRLLLTAALSASLAMLSLLVAGKMQSPVSPPHPEGISVLFIAVRTMFDFALLGFVFAPLTSIARDRSIDGRARYLLPIAAVMALGTLFWLRSLSGYSLVWTLASFGLAGTIWALVDLKWPFRNAYQRERDDPELAAASSATFGAVKIGIGISVFLVLAPLALLALAFLINGPI